MSFFDYFSKAVSYLEDPSTKPAGLAAIYGGISGAGTAMPGATTGTDAIPDYEFVRERVPIDYDEERRPGSRGRRYFSDFVYAPAGAGSSYASDLGIQAAALAAANQANMGVEPKFTAPDYQQSSLTQTGTPASQVGSTMPAPTEFTGLAGYSPTYKRGGLAALARGGYYLGGTTDGMADRVPARIDGVEEARLSDGEFVVPADVVSHLGNGNSNAGAKQLYSMMDRVRQARTGRTEQGKEINPKQFMPSQGQRS
jgi:hypothetical protein